MLKRFLILVAVLLSLGSVGCAASSRMIQAQTANGIAQSANTMLPWILERYNQEGLDALREVKAAGGGRTQAVEAVKDVKRSWAPIWDAWATLQLAHDKWSTLLEEGLETSSALRELKDAYCKLRLIFPSRLPIIPLGIIKCEEEREDEQGSSGSTGPSVEGSDGGISRSGSRRDRGEHHVDRLEGGFWHRGGRG